MAQISRGKARKFIDGVRKDNGGLTKEDTSFLQQNIPHVLEMYNNIRRKLGASTKTLATNLYAKDSRFVYELIQNAEDNHYHTAQLDGKPPELSFSLNQDRIIIDSNEDGFSEANIKAICSIGESTKKNKQGYVGEKGIGFKSVFKVARKVHVQSGPFSFAFEYLKEDRDDGLGMITPVYENHLEVPEGVQTRIILYLLDTCDRDALSKELSSLPDTLLLFLKKLKKLTVQINVLDKPFMKQVYRLEDTGNPILISKCVITSNSPDVTSKRLYWITRRREHNMPQDDARKGIDYAEVVLAFPLDENSIPVLEEQHVYAYLPLRKVGYKFLIQSDFITQASREDVFDSPWNRHLLNKIHQAFMDSVEEFLRHPTLKYHWVRYIPSEPIADDFWGRLQKGIVDELRLRPLFISESNNYLQPTKLRVVSERFRDSDKNPLLPDIGDNSSAYISERYDEHLDVSVLRKLGTVDLSMHDFLLRLRKDLDDNGTTCRMRSIALESDWHTTVAQLLISSLDIFENFVKRLPIIPLQSGTWAHSLNATIHFPFLGGIAVPTDLPLSLVDAKHLGSYIRTLLFVKLGVTFCQPSKVFPLIEQRYKLHGILYLENLSHLKFIYWHYDEFLPKGTAIRVVGRGKFWFSINESKEWTYSSRSKGPYTVLDTLGYPLPDGLVGHVNVPNEKYYVDFQNSEHRNGYTWPDWLDKFLNAKSEIQLCQRYSEHLMSEELMHIATNKPDIILNILERNWSQYRKLNTWDTFFKNLQVPILVRDPSCTRKLESTFLPLPLLCSIASRLGLGADFGFLRELSGLTDAAASQWSFLKHFGVGIDADISFWLNLLKQARTTANVKSEAVFEIYSNLQKFDSSDDMETIRDFFSQDCVLIPSTLSDGCLQWTRITACVWSAPEWFKMKHCLTAFREYERLSNLFTIVLGTGTANTEDFLAYLQFIKLQGSRGTFAEDQLKISQLYKELHKQVANSSDSDHIKARIEQESLIFDPKRSSWHSPSQCVWAEDRIQLPSKISLASSYKDHKLFFTRVLAIQTPSLEMHIVSLKQKAEDEPNKATIFQEMLNICALNPTSEVLRTLEGCKCLPVKTQSGATVWYACSTDFAIVDRREYGAMFDGKIRILDFSLEEVHSLRPFLLALGLEERHLSIAVKENTTAQDNDLHARLTRDLRKKAYAIYRYAAHLGMKKTSEEGVLAYRKLQQISVHVSDGISKTVSIQQDRKTVEVPRETAYLHLDSQEDNLNLYVPRDQRRRQVCLHRQLPKTLLKYLGAANISAYERFGAIITAPTLVLVDDFLEHDGIIEIDGIQRSVEDEEYDSDASSIQRSSPQHQNAPGYLNTPTRPSDLHSRNSSRSRGFTPPSSVARSIPVTPERPDLYEQLLDAVIRQAEDISDLPNVKENIASNLAPVSGLSTLLAVRSPYDGEEKFKIGAAGELFVYELLKNLSLPEFDLTNWQSGIRSRVSVHPNYEGLLKWPGKETTDIVYKDELSTFTTMLIDKGYLERSIWEDCSPTYYIEVKTTPQDVSYPFFCSQSQYDIMEDMHLPFGSDRDKVYLVARVFRLGTGGMGFRLYVDPASLQERGELEFKADKYAVTPTY